jgi:DNA polymerase III delta prime subunit
MISPYRVLFSGFEDEDLKREIEKSNGKIVTHMKEGVDIIVYVKQDDMKKATSFYNIKIYEKEEFINKFFN